MLLTINMTVITPISAFNLRLCHISFTEKADICKEFNHWKKYKKNNVCFGTTKVYSYRANPLLR